VERNDTGLIKEPKRAGMRTVSRPACRNNTRLAWRGVIGPFLEKAVANGLVPNPTGFDIPILKVVKQTFQVY
jgi:hypothetical protein